jgi:hypothetical protein
MGGGNGFDPHDPPRVSGPVVDYALARKVLISEVRRGVVATTDACDAHPELVRAGRNIGGEAAGPCPICSHETLRTVRYVYGDELGRNSGRVVYPEEWLAELEAAVPEFTCYEVEVCTDCQWNHLIRSYVAGKGHRRVAPRQRRSGGA